MGIVRENTASSLVPTSQLKTNKKLSHVCLLSYSTLFCLVNLVFFLFFLSIMFRQLYYEFR